MVAGILEVQGRVQRITDAFDRFAPFYDALTAVHPGYGSSLRRSVALAPIERPARVLDLCSGTGSSTRALRSAFPEAELVAVDGSQTMISHALAKKDLADVRFVHGDAMHLDVCDLGASFDLVFVAFGLRNMPDRAAFLRGVRSVMAPKGYLVVHDYVLDGSKRAEWTWRTVMRGVVRPLGALTTKQPDMLRYLQDSVLQLGSTDSVSTELVDAGFESPGIWTAPGWQKGLLHTLVTRHQRSFIP